MAAFGVCGLEDGFQGKTKDHSRRGVESGHGLAGEIGRDGVWGGCAVGGLGVEGVEIKIY